jgi:hypothetical protein
VQFVAAQGDQRVQRPEQLLDAAAGEFVEPVGEVGPQQRADAGPVRFDGDLPVPAEFGGDAGEGRSGIGREVAEQGPAGTVVLAGERDRVRGQVAQLRGDEVGVGAGDVGQDGVEPGRPGGYRREQEVGDVPGAGHERGEQLEVDVLRQRQDPTHPRRVERARRGQRAQAQHGLGQRRESEADAAHVGEAQSDANHRED